MPFLQIGQLQEGNEKMGHWKVVASREEKEHFGKGQRRRAVEFHVEQCEKKEGGQVVEN